MNFGLFIGSGWANVDFTGILNAILDTTKLESLAG